MNSATDPRSVPTIVRQADRDITSVREALGITTPAPVILISGGADTFDPAIAPKLTQLIGRGLLRAGRAAGAVIIDGGPGTTNNIAPPNIVSVGNNTGVLGVMLPTTATLFGYGFAILDIGTVANATTISLFMGSTPVGSLSYPGASDPLFTGGFAGIESTISFNRAELTFNSVVAPAFAVDNVRYSGVVPEPATAPVVLAALALACASWRRRPIRN